MGFAHGARETNDEAVLGKPDSSRQPWPQSKTRCVRATFRLHRAGPAAGDPIGSAQAET